MPDSGGNGEMVVEARPSGPSKTLHHADLRIRRAVHQPVDPGVDHRPEAHRARFEGDVEGGAADPVVGRGAAGTAQGDNFGVSGRVVRRDRPIAARTENLTGTDHDRPDRHLARPGSCPCQAQGPVDPDPVRRRGRHCRPRSAPRPAHPAHASPHGGAKLVVARQVTRCIPMRSGGFLIASTGATGSPPGNATSSAPSWVECSPEIAPVPPVRYFTTSVPFLLQCLTPQLLVQRNSKVPASFGTNSTTAAFSGDTRVLTSKSLNLMP